jgi:hypothetical protein
MVKEVILNKKKDYQCEDCKLIYKEKRWADKCEKWCKKHKSCSLEITKHKIK